MVQLPGQQQQLQPGQQVLMHKGDMRRVLVSFHSGFGVSCVAERPAKPTKLALRLWLWGYGPSCTCHVCCALCVLTKHKLCQVVNLLRPCTAMHRLVLTCTCACLCCPTTLQPPHTRTHTPAAYPPWHS
jgi:hypothetical protein